MQASKENIIAGVITYINGEVMPHITNNNFKFVLSALTSSMEVNPALADKVFSNPMIAFALQETGGLYDIDYAEQILTKTMRECGELTFEVPAVPILLPDAQKLKFTSEDVTNLFRCIKGVM